MDLYQGITVFGLNDIAGNSAIGLPGVTAPPALIEVGGVDTVTGFAHPLHVDAAGNLYVNASITPPSDNTSTGAITSTQNVAVSTEGTSALMVQITGTWTGTLDFQVSLDGTTWQAVNLYPAIPDGSPAVSSTTTNGNFTLPVGGIQQFRVLGATVATGTANIWLTAGQGQYGVFNYSDNAANFLATVTQGPAGASPWLQNVTEWASTVLGAPTAWGTAPTGNVIGVNAEMFAGNTALTATGTALNVNIASTTGGTLTVAGNLTNNNAAPVADNIGVLPAVASAANPTYTAGFQVLLSTDLAGNLRTKDAADGTPGAAVPATATQVAGSDGTNLQTIKTTTKGTQVVIPADEAEAASLNYFTADSGSTPLSVTGSAPVLTIQANSAAIIFLLRGVVFFTGGQQARYQVIKNAALTGATYAATLGNMNVDTAATSLTGGTVVDAGYTGVNHIDKVLLQAIAAGAPGDTFTIYATAISGTAKVFGTLSWSEQASSL